MPVNSAKRKRGDGEVGTEPLKKRPATEATATTVAANPTASTITAATTAAATPTAAVPAAITPAATAATPTTITPAAPTTATTGRPKIKINVEMLKKKTEELRRKNLEAANNRNNVGGAATSAPVTPQADNTKSDLQKKIDEKRKTHKQKTAAIKSRTAAATATPTIQQQQVLPSPPSSNAASPDASPCTDSQRDFTEELKQAKLKRISTTDVSMPATKSAMQVAPLPSSDMMPSTLPHFKTSPIPSIEESNITFNMIRTDDVGQYEHTFDVFDYTDSVPILFSADIAHDDGIWDVYTSNDVLMAMALDLIIKGKTALKDGLPWKGLPLGRKNGSDSSLPTKIITDVDLYLRLADNKVYVASEQGLVLAASYLTLIGVPPTQKVKWNGRIPMWAQAAELERHERRVMVEWEATEPDHLDVMRGAFIHVHERRDDGMAFCRTFDGTKMGWFPYALTGHVIFGYKTDGLNDTASSPEPKEVYPPWDGVYLHITHPELATKDEFDDMSDSDDDEQKPANVDPAAATATTTTAATRRAETDRRVQDIEVQMAALKAKIQTATAAKKAKAAAAEAAKKAAPTATPQAAPSASPSSTAETGVETPSGADGEGIDGPAEGAGREAEVGGEEEEEKKKEVKGLETTSAFDKSRRTPWECGEEDFVDWDDDEL
jgi:hypothetical protein